MRRTMSNLLGVAWSAPRMAIKKLAHGDSFHCTALERFSPNVVLEFRRGSVVTLGDRVRAHSGTKIKALEGARLYIGSNVRINYNCMFMCMDSISIGEGTEFGPAVCIYDHDHDYKAGLKSDKFVTAPVSIGKNCWIGANTVILRGTKLGDNCVVGAGCVLSGEYPDNSVIVQKRDTTVTRYEVRE